MIKLYGSCLNQFRFAGGEWKTLKRENNFIACLDCHRAIATTKFVLKRKAKGNVVRIRVWLPALKFN